MMKHLYLLCLLIAAPSVFADSLQDDGTVVGTWHMVSAANPLASQAGLDVLEAGGTAMDAAVAVQFILNLVASEKRLVTYDGREKAPSSATPEYFFNEEGEPKKWSEALTGGMSVGVPGTLKLLEVAHSEHGLKPWGNLLQPAIEASESGFVISSKLSESIEAAGKRGLAIFQTTREYFFNEDGSAREAGSILKNPAFANTLKLIAANGSDPFYFGEIAQSIVDAVKTETNTGQLTLDDMASYTVVKREPICFDYRDYQVCGMGPPTSGGLTMGQILTMLSHHDLPGMGASVESWHLYIEAAKLAYADRGLYMADSDFVDMPQGLLNKRYLSDRAALISPDRAMLKAEAGVPPWDEAQLWSRDTQIECPGTSHFVIADRYGNAVSMTTTIESGFGSRVMTGGFLLNNELTDFSFVPERDGKPVANRVEGNKRPRSSMSPTIVFRDGWPHLLTGSPGGSRIINYATQSVIAILDWNMSPQTALNMGHVVNRNGKTDLEEGTEATDLQIPLESLGHEINVRSLNSGLHTILMKPGKLYGAADPRREGVALGR